MGLSMVVVTEEGWKSALVGCFYRLSLVNRYREGPNFRMGCDQHIRASTEYLEYVNGLDSKAALCPSMINFSLLKCDFNTTRLEKTAPATLKTLIELLISQQWQTRARSIGTNPKRYQNGSSKTSTKTFLPASTLPSL